MMLYNIYSQMHNFQNHRLLNNQFWLIGIAAYTTNICLDTDTELIAIDAFGLGFQQRR